MRYRKIVASLETVFDNLRALPPDKLALAANYIQCLRDNSTEEADLILSQTAGALDPEEADAMERAIEDGCERIDAPSW